jgi:hypothetical protein
VTRIALASVEGFALAGSGAIREHGVIDRPTEDVDLFTANADEDAFSVAIDHVTARLRSSGCEVELTRRAEHFARLHVVTAEGVQLDVDLGVDWRQDQPVRLAVGPVLSLDDAVGSKVGALYSRGEVRDYLDVDAIRSSGRGRNPTQQVSRPLGRTSPGDVGQVSRGPLRRSRVWAPPSTLPGGTRTRATRGPCENARLPGRLSGGQCTTLSPTTPPMIMARNAILSPDTGSRPVAME